MQPGRPTATCPGWLGAGRYRSGIDAWRDAEIHGGAPNDLPHRAGVRSPAPLRRGSPALTWPAIAWYDSPPHHSAKMGRYALSPRRPVARPPFPDPTAIASRAPLGALSEIGQQHGPATARGLDIAPHGGGRVGAIEILRSPQQRAQGESPVSSGPPRLLVVRLERAGRA